jgi:hypothetical protein
VRHGKREVFWFGFLFLTFLLSAISGAEIRRLLLFDFGWCYFAALGALPLVNRLSLPATALLFAPVGLYGLLAIQTILVNPPEEISALPFGSGRLGEGITCYSCYQRGLLWREDFSRGRAVILVDSDEQRETVLNPGGLALYGELAAREFGARERFLQFYPVLKNRKVEHPKLPAPYFDSGDGFDFITPRIAGTEVVWHFEQPTPEEQPLIHALSALAAELGGTVERSSHLYVRTIRGTLPKDTIRIVFPASAAQQSIERIRALAPLPPPERG